MKKTDLDMLEKGAKLLRSQPSPGASACEDAVSEIQELRKTCEYQEQEIVALEASLEQAHETSRKLRAASNLNQENRQQLSNQSEKDPMLHNLVVSLDSVPRGEGWTTDAMANAMIVLSRELCDVRVKLTQLMNRDVSYITPLAIPVKDFEAACERVLEQEPRHTQALAQAVLLRLSKELDQ